MEDWKGFKEELVDAFQQNKRLLLSYLLFKSFWEFWDPSWDNFSVRLIFWGLGLNASDRGNQALG